MENKILNDEALEGVAGGYDHANGPYSDFGNYIRYTIAAGDYLGFIAQRFGVTVAELQQWNNIKNPDFIRAGDVLTIYARIKR